jgi:glycosyltransferase involved in cell wall biosynthesis
MLRRAIESALAQTLTDLEVIVCDDRGASAGVATEFAEPRVRYVRNRERPGPAGNLVMAIASARGEIITVLNEDDALEPGYLEAASAVLASDGSVGAIFAPNIWEAGAHKMVVQPGIGPGRHGNPLCAVLQHGVPPVAVAIRRTAWDEGERHTPLGDGMVGDLMLSVRTARDGWAFYGLSEPFGRWAIHRGQLGWRSDYAERMRTTLEALRFGDEPEAERLRLARLAECHAAQAGVELRSGHLLEAARAMRSAGRIAPGGIGIRHLLAAARLWQAGFQSLAAHPRLLFGLWRLWGRLRPGV